MGNTTKRKCPVCGEGVAVAVSSKPDNIVAAEEYLGENYVKHTRDGTAYLHYG